jgi:hypothetical protein
MTISTQAMTATGDGFSYSRKARPQSDFGPMKVVKNEPFTDMEIAQLDALIKKNLNEFFDPL